MIFLVLSSLDTIAISHPLSLLDEHDAIGSDGFFSTFGDYPSHLVNGRGFWPISSEVDEATVCHSTIFFPLQMDLPFFGDMDSSEMQEEDQQYPPSKPIFDKDDDNITRVRALSIQEEAEIPTFPDIRGSFGGVQDISGGLLHTGVGDFSGIHDTCESLTGGLTNDDSSGYSDSDNFNEGVMSESHRLIPGDIIPWLASNQSDNSSELEDALQPSKLFIITATILAFLDIFWQTICNSPREDSFSDIYSGSSSSDSSISDIQEPRNQIHISPPSSPHNKPIGYHQQEGEDMKGEDNEEVKRRRIPFPPNEGEAIINLYNYYTRGREYRKIIDIARRIHLDLYMDPTPSAEIQELRTQLGITIGNNSTPIRSVISVRDHLYNYRKLNHLVRRHKKKRRCH